MFILAQIFGIFVIIFNVIAMQMKHKNQIFFMLIFVSIFSALNFILLKSYSGCFICLFAIIQIIINYCLGKKNKPIPKILVGLYIIISIIIGTFTYKTYIDILPIICSILYTITILQKNEKRIRLISLINIILWIIYDFVSCAYTAGIADILTLVSTLIGIYRYDYKKE